MLLLVVNILPQTFLVLTTDTDRLSGTRFRRVKDAAEARSTPLIHALVKSQRLCAVIENGNIVIPSEISSLSGNNIIVQ